MVSITRIKRFLYRTSWLQPALGRVPLDAMALVATMPATPAMPAMPAMPATPATPALVHPVVQERLGPEDIKNAVARGLQKDFLDRCVQERSQ